MPETGFIAWRKWIQQVAAAAGLSCSNRKACAMVVPVATHFGLIDNGLPLQPPHGDPVGETVVANILRQRLTPERTNPPAATGGGSCIPERNFHD